MCTVRGRLWAVAQSLCTVRGRLWAVAQSVCNAGVGCG